MSHALLLTDLLLVPRISPFLVLLGALVVGGCSEDVVSPGAIEATYTLWGAFDPLADVQRVRVIPITDTIGLGSPAPLPVSVTSVDLATGAQTAWADSAVTFSDGSYGHVYQARLRPSFGSRHLFRVDQEGGTLTSAIVSVPPIVEPVRQTPSLPLGVEYPVLWPDAPRLNQVRATYTLGLGGCDSRRLENKLKAAAGPVEFGWRTVLNLRKQADELALRVQGSSKDPVPFTVRRIDLAVEVASSDWRPPGGVFDPDVLVEPGTLSNVTNGFGFVGSAYTLSVSWSPTAEELSRANLPPPGFGC